MSAMRTQHVSAIVLLTLLCTFASAKEPSYVGMVHPPLPQNCKGGGAGEDVDRHLRIYWVTCFAENVDAGSCFYPTSPRDKARCTGPEMLWLSEAEADS